MNDLINTVNMLTPSIGEIYLTISDENPSVKFGGTWEQIKDVFLLSAGDNYVAGSIGGESEHVLTVDEMPSHTHELNRPQWSRYEQTGTDSGVEAYGVTNKTDTNIYNNTTGSIINTGGNQAHNNMPPYLVVYAWKRIA